MTREAIKFKITAAGRAATASPPSGLRAAFTHIAIGKGDAAKPADAAGYQPTGDETALEREFMRAPLSAGSKPAPDQIAFTGQIDGNETGWIHEIGLFLDDGTLWAVWSEDSTVIQRYDEDNQPVYGAPLGYKALGVPFLLSAVVTVQDFDLDSIDIVVNGPPISVTVNRYDSQMLNLLAIVTDRARALHDLEAARRADEARLGDLIERNHALEARVAALEERFGS
ncbi:phage tail-collar fiber domain-containing protein [Methylocystis sp. S23]